MCVGEWWAVVADVVDRHNIFSGHKTSPCDHALSQMHTAVRLHTAVGTKSNQEQKKRVIVTTNASGSGSGAGG